MPIKALFVLIGGLVLLSCTTTLKDKALDTLDPTLVRNGLQTPLAGTQGIEPGNYQLIVKPQITGGKVITDPNYFDLEIESSNRSFKVVGQNWWGATLEAKSFSLEDLVDKPFYELTVSVIKNPLPPQTLTFPFSWAPYILKVDSLNGSDGADGTNGTHGKNPADQKPGVELSDSDKRGAPGGDGTDAGDGKDGDFYLGELDMGDLLPPEYLSKRFLVLVNTKTRSVKFGFQNSVSYDITSIGGRGGSGGRGGDSYGDNPGGLGGGGGNGGNGGDINLTSYRENLLSLFRLVSDGGSGGGEGPIGSGKNPNVGTVIMGAIINSVLGTDTSKAGRSGLEGRVRKGLMKFDQFKSDMSLYIGPKLADRLKP